MTAWSTARRLGWSTRAVIALGLLAVLLVVAVPAALFVGLIMMLFGHVLGGLALFGASILAATVAVVIATLTGVQQLRKALTRQGFGRQMFSGQVFGAQGFGSGFDEQRFGDADFGDGDFGEPNASRGSSRVVQLGRSDYSDN